MTGDPFADGMPAGDFHTWVRPQGDACPDCECCTAALCEKARDTGFDCSHHVSGRAHIDVSMCACTTRLKVFGPAQEGAKHFAMYGAERGYGDTPEQAKADLLGKLTTDQQAYALKSVTPDEQ